MDKLYYCTLENRGLLTLAGSDARNFLQGLVSNDINKVTLNHSIYAALLSPQGKFLHDFFIHDWHDGLLLEIENDRRDDLIHRLSRYKLRADISFNPLSDYKVMAVWGENAPPQLGLTLAETHRQDESIYYTDPRHARLGLRILSPSQSETLQYPEAIPAAFETYDAMRIQLGISDGSRDFIIDKSFPLEHGLEELHGVDFSKGCYVGQELTSRTKYRGVVRKHVYVVRSEIAALPASGTPVMYEGSEAGIMRSSQGPIGLAILRHEFVQQSQQKSKPLTAAEVEISATLPYWAHPPFEHESTENMRQKL